MMTGLTASPRLTGMPPATLPAPIDTHAHCFLASLPMAPQRRYTPGYDASVEQFLAVLDHHGVAAGVLVQPSFLGTDNSYLVRCLAAHPTRLRGIAVVDPGITDTALSDLAAVGVVGVRFNLIDQDAAILDRPDLRDLVRRVAALGWQIEVQADGPQWSTVLRALDRIPTTIVADHFGRPTLGLGRACPGFQLLLREGPSGRLYVKLSAPYRVLGSVDGCLEDLFAQLGPDRLLWGSDWPWTQHEANRRYQDWLALTDRAGSVLAHRLAATAGRLFGFVTER